MKRRETSTSSSIPSGKLSEKHFTPRSLKLAQLSCTDTQTSISTDNAFPTDKDAAVWSVIKKAANAAGYYTLFDRISKDVFEKEKMIKYVCATCAVSYLLKVQHG